MKDRVPVPGLLFIYFLPGSFFEGMGIEGDGQDAVCLERTRSFSEIAICINRLFCEVMDEDLSFGKALTVEIDDVDLDSFILGTGYQLHDARPPSS